MKVLLLIIAWCVLLALSWPIALIALIAAPIVWLLSLPLRLIGVCVESLLALLRAVLLLPARVLGHRGYRHEDLAEPDAGDELPPSLSARSLAAIRTRRSRSILRFRRQSLSFALECCNAHALWDSTELSW
jgi:hypothetical protein